MRDGNVYVDPRPIEADRREHWTRKLQEGLEQNIRLVLAKSLIGLDELAATDDVLTRAALFAVEQQALAARVPVRARDLAYGPDPRQRLDLYGGGDGRPVLVFVHGGGFVTGDKGGEDWANANVGRMTAEAGLIGCVINYRLAPDHGWPAGSEDVGAVVDWLRDNIAAHGGDPARIVLAGFSQGGAMALQTGLRHPERLAGILALSCALPLADRLAAEAHPANRDVPILMAHGTGDDVIPIARARRSRDVLVGLGYRVDWREYPMPHAIVPAEIRDIAAWLRGVIAV